MDDWANTTAQPTFNLKEVANLPIPFPPANEQRAIASILGALDDKIELNRRMNETLEALARRAGWPPLYDAARLRANTVPAASAIYFNDMYVPTEFSLRTAGTIAGLRPWVTSEYEHDGLRVSHGAVLDRLIGLARGEL